MNLHKHFEDIKLELQIAPLIDVVFLLLIYFMVTAALIRKEGDISFMLPSESGASIPDIPVEVMIEIAADGGVQIEGMQFARDDRALDDLVLQVAGLKQVAASSRSKFFVNIMPHEDTLHRRIIDVMDACAAAGVEQLTFAPATQ